MGEMGLAGKGVRGEIIGGDIWKMVMGMSWGRVLLERCLESAARSTWGYLRGENVDGKKKLGEKVISGTWG